MPEVKLDAYTRKVFPIDFSIASKKLYDRFCEEHPNINISFQQYKEIIYTHNYALRDYILETGDAVKLPRGFGMIAINKWKSKRYIKIKGKEYITLAIDWVKSKKAGKKIYNLNSHTDGFRYKWRWFINTTRMYASDIWLFIPTRTSSRLLAKYLKEPDSPYKQLYKTWINSA